MQRTPRSASARSKKKQETPRDKKLANAAIIGLSALLVVGGGLALVQNERAQARSSQAADTYTPRVAATPGPTTEPFAPMGDTINRLGDKSKPYTITVLGDSTGNDPNEWVYLVVQRLAEETGRPAVIHDWSIDTNSYVSETEITGDGDPIVVWNGSASGKRAAYSQEHGEKMAPEESDLVIINHGHNQGRPDAASTEVRALAKWAKEKWDTPPALAITLQNTRLDDKAAQQTRIVEQLQEDWGGKEDVTLIDVLTAFNDADDMAALLRDDKFHPNEEGEIVWADTVWEDLNLDEV